MKRTIEIEDELPDILQSVCDDIKEVAIQYLNDNPKTDEAPELGNDLDYSGRVHEIIDGAVPVYTNEIRDIFYLHPEVEDAFDDAGFGEKDDKMWPCGWHAAAIYCWLQQKSAEWYEDEKDEIYYEWRAAHPVVDEEAEADDETQKEGE